MSDHEPPANEASSKSEKQRIRKRELDRRAQRTARVKTKNRIAYLEGVVETFRGQDAAGANASLMAQLEGVSAERDGLRRFLQSLDDSIRSHLAGDSDAVSLNPPNRPKDQGSGNPDLKDQSTENSNASVKATRETPLSHATQPLPDPSSITVPADADMSLLDFGSEMDYSIDGSINFNLSAARAQKAAANIVPAVEQLASSPDTDDQTTVCAPVIIPVNSSAPSTCSCSSSRTRRLLDGTEVSFNIWRAANQVLNKPAKLLDENSDCDSISDDIIVRAILEGWDSVLKGRRLSPIWEKVRQLDELGFMACSQVERFGILWIVHLLMPSQHDAKTARSTTLPLWYKKPFSTHGRHPPAVEYLPWPGVRESFIQSHHRYCQNTFWHLFKEHVRIIWPFEFRDCFTQDANQGRYRISSVFEQTIRNSRSWTMERDFFGSFPELHQEIPVFLDIIPPPPRFGAWDLGQTPSGRLIEHGSSYQDDEDQFFSLPLLGPLKTGWNINDYDRPAGY
ncbi:hypothetical protein B0J13DRAFT_557400 [Dactylonectria estremocensis]|uniref:BZIP domain-containing protein n=1 Tax=Dactylonectria estremocensis TaxID=1079267 RepID=A0A9P9J305_9HYPO|nr:hypothetical protein B0J13DRAFT_557400 [Dactylonectria estremocensis]